MLLITAKKHGTSSTYKMNKHITILFFLLFSTLNIRAQITLKVDAKESTCSANGQVCLTVTNGTAPYRFELDSVGGTIRRIQNDGCFEALAKGSYRIKVTDAASKTTQIFATVAGNYVLPTLVANTEGSCVRMTVTGGRKPFRFYATPNGGVKKALDTIPTNDPNKVFCCVPNGIYTFEVEDSCQNFYPFRANISVSNPSFAGKCEQKGDTINVIVTSFSGGEKPYTFTCVGDTGGVRINNTGVFNNLFGCGFEVTMTDSCGRSFKQRYDCTPENLTAKIVCSNAQTGNVTIKASGGTPTYKFVETTSNQSNSTGVFDNLPKNRRYNFKISDQCGRVKDIWIDTFRLYWREPFIYTSCPYDGKLSVRTAQQRCDDSSGCVPSNEYVSSFFPIKYSCATCTPNVLIDPFVNTIGKVSGVIFTNMAPTKHFFTAENNCGEILNFSTDMDTSKVPLSARIDCNGGLITARSSLAGVRFILKDKLGNPLDTNFTGNFAIPTPDTFYVSGSIMGCRENQVIATFTPSVVCNPPTCDSVGMTVCPNIGGYSFKLKNDSGDSLKTSLNPYFTNLNFAKNYTVVVRHPQLKDSLTCTFQTDFLPKLRVYDVACSFFRVGFDYPYSYRDQHAAPLTVTLKKAKTGEIVQQYVLRNLPVTFDSLLADSYRLFVTHPFCGERDTPVVILSAPPQKLCFTPSNRIVNQKCVASWSVSIAGSAKDYRLKGGPENLDVATTINAPYFRNILPGTYTLETECTFQTFVLPNVTHKMKASAGPSCPQAGQIVATGARSSGEWTAFGVANGIDLCSGGGDYYRLFDTLGRLIANSNSGIFDNNLSPGNKYYVTLYSAGCDVVLDSVRVPYYIRSVVTAQFGVLCQGVTTSDITMTIAGGRPKYTYEILNPRIRPPVVTDSSKAVFSALPAGTYSVRAFDECRISADFSGSIAPLSISTDFKRKCNGDVLLIASKLLGASYKWTNAKGDSIGNVPELLLKNRSLDTQTYYVKVTLGFCDFTQKVSVFKINQTVSPNAGVDFDARLNTAILKASPIPNTAIGNWIASPNNPSATTFDDPTSPTSKITVGNVAGKYTYTWEVDGNAESCIAEDSVVVNFINCATVSQIPVSIDAVNAKSCANSGVAKAIVGAIRKGPLSILWSTGDTTATITKLAVGMYKVTVTDASVCTDTVVKMVEITAPKPLVASVIPTNIFCHDKPDGNALAIARGGFGTYTFFWSNGQKDSLATRLKAGIYRVTIADKQTCDTVITVTLTEPLLISSSRKDTICQGDSLKIGRFVHKRTGRYVDTLQNFAGCDSVVSINLVVHTVYSVRLDTTLCFGDSMQLANIFYRKTGVYSHVFSTQYGCDSLVTLRLNVPTALENLVTARPTCEGTSNGDIRIQTTGGTPPYFYRWFHTTDTFSSVRNLKAGVYSFTLKDKLGCLKTDSVALENYARPQFQIIPKLPCVNGSEYGIGSLQLKAEKSDSLRWGFSRFWLQETPTLVGVPKGEYTMWVRDKQNCDYTEKVKLQAQTPLEVILPADTLINLGDSFRLNPTVLNGIDSMRFRWNPPVYLSCDTCQNPWTKPPNEILYRLNVQNKEGCQNNATMLIRVEKNQKVFIPNVFSPNSDGTNEFFIPYTRNAKRIQIFRIFNRWGEMVFENKNFEPNQPNLGWDGLFKGQILKPDVFVYYLEVLFESGDVGIFKGDITLMR
jgi:gliding motility-associated-like protein